MAWFGKKKEFVDLTDMQKRGLLPDNSFQNEGSVGDDGIVDLSSMGGSSSSGSASQTESSEDTSGLGFLGGLAGANVNNSNSVNSTSQTESSVSSENTGYTERLRRARAGSLDTQHLKTKIDDLEYKIDRLVERISKMEGKL